jgi:hypothetical protein
MTFPINNTEALFNYLGRLNGVSWEGKIETNIETIEFKLNNKPWIHAKSIESMEKQGLFKIAEKVANDQYPINILFTKDEIFINDLLTENIPIFSIDFFLQWLFREHEELLPSEYRAFSELKSLNYSFTNLLADTLRVKEENIQLKHDKQNLVHELSETHRKLKSAEDSIESTELKRQGYAKTILDLAKFTIEKNKLLTGEQIQSLKKHYNENKNEYINGCSITFYKTDKIISSNYYKFECHWIEGAGVTFRADEKTFIFFDKNGVELLKHDYKAEVLFELPWPALSAILKIPNPVDDYRNLFI